MPTDWKLISCGEEHEMVYMLGKCNKELTKDNINKLFSVCKQFKDDPDFEPHNRENFYKYITEKHVMKVLD